MWTTVSPRSNLGGGSGWAERAFGLACDNLFSVDLVTAVGREVTASEGENPVLFWALPVGVSNFGVATSFVFALHDLGPLVTAGLFECGSGDVGLEVARMYRDYAYTAPDQFGSGLIFITGPAEDFVPSALQGTDVAAITVFWRVGGVDEGAEAIGPCEP